MTVQWIPLADYTGDHHVLGAGVCFVHPLNGNRYYWDCVQVKGTRQNLNIYRQVGMSEVLEKVVTFEGTKDAQTFIERGQCVIATGGALLVATSLQPKDVPYVTETGFQGVRCRIPNVDDPWSFAQFEQRLVALEKAVAQLTTGITPNDRLALDRLKDFLEIPE